MGNAVKVSEGLLNSARIIAEDNPDLPLSFIQDILQGREEIKQGLATPYVFGEGKWQSLYCSCRACSALVVAPFMERVVAPFIERKY